MTLSEIKQTLLNSSKLTAKDAEYHKLMADSIALAFNQIQHEIKAAYLEGQTAGIEKCCKAIKVEMPEQQEDWTLPF